MSDKLRPGISVLTTFSDGEQPTAAKLSSITAQLRNAALELEKAVGDIYGESWPYSSSSTTTLNQEWGRALTSNLALTGAEERKLDIVNLGRLIGPASNLNPRMLDSESITENIPAGVHEFALRWKPADPSALVFSDTVTFATYVPVVTDLLAAGDWTATVDGKVYVVTVTVGGSVTYTTDPETYGGGLNYQGGEFNVIPDPNQLTAGGTGITLSAPDGQGRRTCSLPAATHAQSNIEVSTTALDADDPIYSKQLVLPSVLVSNYTAGDQIPPGFLFLRNHTTGRLYRDATYYFNNANSFLISGSTQLTADINAGHKFIALTVGTNITTAIDDLRLKSFHSHDRKFGEPLIHIDNIVGILEDEGSKGLYVPSEIPGNFAPQYLHRNGWASAGDTDDNLNDQNAMRGHLVLGRLGASPGSYVTTTGSQSYSLYFGHPSSIPTRIRRDADDNLVLEAQQSGGTDGIRGVRIQSGPLITELGLKGNTDPSSASGAWGARLAGNLRISSWAGTGTIVLTAAGNVSTGKFNLPAVPDEFTNTFGFHFLMEDTSGEWWASGGSFDATGSHQYQAYFDDNTSPKSIQIVATAGASGIWETGTYNVRSIVWYVPS